MERKIGEIFEYKGEWYQCVESPGCALCAFNETDCNDIDIGDCASYKRSDGKSVIFKKLEKVGEPYAEGNSIVSERMFQKYRTYEKNFFLNERDLLFTSYGDIVSIEIKQNQEDMEEKKQGVAVLETTDKRMRPFDLIAAKAGKPVCTRDGRKARIICFDRNHQYPVVALIECKDGEEMIAAFTKDGETDYEPKNHGLMMLPEKKERWVNVYNCLGVITFSHNPYDTKEEALEELKSASGRAYCVDTIKISWEE